MNEEIKQLEPVSGRKTKRRSMGFAIVILSGIAFSCLCLFMRFSTDPVAYFLWKRIIVMNSPRWGYINRFNKLIIDFNSIQTKYYPYFMGPFVENRAKIQILSPDGKKLFLFIDKNGVARSNVYLNLAEYSEGLAAAEQSNGSGFGYINQNGRWVIKPMYKNAQSFSGGLAAVQDRSTDLWGYINKEGRIVVPFKYSSASRFCEGLAVVSSGRKYGYLDKTGFCKIPLIYDFCWDFSEGLGVVEKNISRYNKYERIYLSREGYLVFKYVDVQHRRFFEKEKESAANDVGKQENSKSVNGPEDPTFYNGLAVKHSNGFYGFIDKTGDFVIAPRFSFARPFRESYAVVYSPKNLNYCGAIDTKGKLEIAFKFKQLGDFAEGLAFATVDDIHFGYVNSLGDYVIESKIIGEAKSFSSGLAAIGRAPEVNL